MKQEDRGDLGVAPPEMAYTPSRHTGAQPAGIFLPAVASQRSSKEYAGEAHSAYQPEYAAPYSPPANYQYQYPYPDGTLPPTAYDSYAAPYDKQYWQDHSRVITQDQSTPRSFAPSYNGAPSPGASYQQYPGYSQPPMSAVTSPTHSHFSRAGPVPPGQRNSRSSLPPQRMSRSSAGSVAGGSPPTAPARVSRTTPRAGEPSHSRSSVHSRSTGTVVQTEAAIYTRSIEEEEEDHAGWVMICLALFTPFYSIFFALYALFSAFFILLRSPFRLCFPSIPVGDEFAQLLCPAITAHLKIVYSTELAQFSSPLSSTPTVTSTSTNSHSKKQRKAGHSSRRGCSRTPQWRLKPGFAVLVLVLAPLVAIPIALATWVAGTFWVFTQVLGNPDGRGRRDDGRVAVLGVRRAWERWVLGCVELS